MESILKELVGRTVLIYSHGGGGGIYTDEGDLERFDENWVCIRKESGEQLYFSTYAIRIIKPSSR